MNEIQTEGFDFSILWPAFNNGFIDSINPCNFASILLFILYLSYIGRTVKRIVFFGAIYIALAYYAQFLIAHGAWDQVFSHDIVLSVIRFGYLILAVLFLYVGICDIKDWWQSKTNKDISQLRLKLPKFFDKSIKERQLNRFKIITSFAKIAVLTIFLSSGSIIAGSIFPQSEYIYIVYSHRLSSGDVFLTRNLFYVYCFAIVFLLIIVWLIILFLSTRKYKNTKVIMYYKGVMSALFISTSVGLGLYFLKFNV